MRGGGWCQADLGAISAEIKSLQDKSMGIGLKLENRKVTGRANGMEGVLLQF